MLILLLGPRSELDKLRDAYRKTEVPYEVRGREERAPESMGQGFGFYKGQFINWRGV